MISDVFVSDCSATWLEAAAYCDAMDAVPAVPEVVYPVAGSLPTSHPPLWVGNFFTPWIWANGIA